MNFFKQNQTIILVIVVVVIAFFVYTYFFTGKNDSAVLQTEEISVEAPVNQDLVSLLLELKSITLDESIFSDPAFTGLQDFSQELVPEAVGRVNPFAPLGQGRPQVVQPPVQPATPTTPTTPVTPGVR